MVTQLRSRSQRISKADFAAGLAALGLAGSGSLHVYQAPMHLDHSWEHAAILFTVGVVDLVWAVAWLRTRSTPLLYAGVFLPMMTVGLYTVSRFLPLPFEGMPEEVTALNLGTQLLEVAGFAAMIGVAALRHRRARTIVATAAAAVVAAWAFYGAALLLAALTTQGGPNQ